MYSSNPSDFAIIRGEIVLVCDKVDQKLQSVMIDEQIKSNGSGMESSCDSSYE